MSKRQGFTLVEVIISIAFLSIVSVVFLQLFLKADVLGQRAALLDDGVLRANAVIEQMKGLQSESAILAWAEEEGLSTASEENGFSLGETLGGLDYSWSLTAAGETGGGAFALYDLHCAVYSLEEEEVVYAFSTRLVLAR